VTRHGSAAPFVLACAWVLAATAAPAADRVYPSAGAVEPLGPGDRVPVAAVETVHGEPVTLAEVRGDGGALLVFYRGGW
jgi:hypothetical protein